MRIAVIGGGVAGLSAAWTLEKARRQGADIEYCVFERATRLGGVIQTEKLDDGSLLEAGPDSFLTEKPWAADLCRELGLGNDLIGSNDAARKTWILLHGRLTPLPDGLQFLVPTRIRPIVTSSLFSAGTKARFAREYLFPPRPLAADQDESVTQFVARHFGRELVERLAEPLLAGIYGGSAGELSVRAVLPRMAKMEAEHRSLIRGVLHARRTQLPAASAPNPLFTTLGGGMQQMTDALAAQLDSACIRLQTEVRSLRPARGAWDVTVAGVVQSFDSIIVALPARAAAALLAEADAELAAQLAAVPYTSSVTVNLGYDRRVLGGADQSRLAGFGFLVPRSERRRLLACTYTHNKFLHRASPQRAIFRCFFAAEKADQIMALPDDQIAALAAAELRDILQLPASPELARVARWPYAMAQYTIGHLGRVTEIERLCQNLPGLALAGNAFRGIGVPDCVRSGTQAAEQLLRAKAALAHRAEHTAPSRVQ